MTVRLTWSLGWLTISVNRTMGFIISTAYCLVDYDAGSNEQAGSEHAREKSMCEEWGYWWLVTTHLQRCHRSSVGGRLLVI